jgi:hypothetical protein
MEGSAGSTNSNLNFARSGWDLQWYMRRTFQDFDFEGYNTNRQFDGRNFTL